MFKDNPVADKTLGLTEEQNVQLMVLKYLRRLFIVKVLSLMVVPRC